MTAWVTVIAQAAARYEDRLNQAAGSPPASGPLGAARHALHWLASPLRRLSGKTLVGAESEKRAVQYITMKVGAAPPPWAHPASIHPSIPTHPPSPMPRASITHRADSTAMPPCCHVV